MKLASGSSFAVAAVAGVLVASGTGRTDDFAARAAKLQRESIVVDTHEDVPWQLLKKWVDLGTPGATKDVDIPRLVKGGVTAPFFAVYLPPEREKTGTAAKETLEIIDVVDRVVASHPEILVSAASVAEIRAAKKAGRIAILKAIEGGTPSRIRSPGFGRTAGSASAT